MLSDQKDFKELFNLHLVESVNDIDCRYFLYAPSDTDDSVKQKIQKSGLFLDRFYLYEVPFLLACGGDILVDALHVGWDVHLPHIDTWTGVLEDSNPEILLLNQLAHNIIISANIENKEIDDANFYELDISLIQELHSGNNLHCYFLRLPSLKKLH